MKCPFRIVADSSPQGYRIEILSNLLEMVTPLQVNFFREKIDDLMKDRDSNFETYERLPHYVPDTRFLDFLLSIHRRQEQNSTSAGERAVHDEHNGQSSTDNG